MQPQSKRTHISCTRQHEYGTGFGTLSKQCSLSPKKTCTGCTTQHGYGTVPDTLSQQGSPGQTLARAGIVTWWKYGVPAQTFCLPPQPAVQLSFIAAFINFKLAFSRPFSFFAFLPPQPAAQLPFIDSLIHCCLHSVFFQSSFLPTLLPLVHSCLQSLQDRSHLLMHASMQASSNQLIILSFTYPFLPSYTRSPSSIHAFFQHLPSPKVRYMQFCIAACGHNLQYRSKMSTRTP